MDEEWNDGVDIFFAEFAESNNNNKSRSMSTRKLNRLKYEHDHNSINERNSNSAFEGVDKETIVAMARRRIAESVLRNASRKDIERARQSLPKSKISVSNNWQMESSSKHVNIESKMKDRNSDIGSTLVSRQNEKNTTMCRKRHKLAHKMERKAARIEERKTEKAKERKAFNKEMSGVRKKSKHMNNKGSNANCWK